MVPVLDDALALRDCLSRLAAQTVPPADVVVVDNGCSDDSAHVARVAGARVVVEPRRGIPAAVATGFDASRADVLARCDADSRVPLDWIERITRRFDADPGLDGLTGPGRFTDLSSMRGRLAWAFYAAGYFGAAGAAGANVPLWGSNMAIRASAWRGVRDRVHRDDPDVHDDLDLSLALGPRARIAFDPGLRVQVSGRMFHSPAAARRRFVLAARTLRLAWADAGPGRRWVARLSGRPYSEGSRPDPARRSLRGTGMTGP